MAAVKSMLLITNSWCYQESKDKSIHSVVNTTASLGCWVRRRWAGSWNHLFLSHGRISPQGFFHLLSPRHSLVFCPHGGYSCTDHSFALGRKWGEHTIISTLNKCWVLGPQCSHITQCLWPSGPSLIHKPLTLLHCQSTAYNLEQAGTKWSVLAFQG